MRKPLLYPIGITKSCRHAAALLKQAGIPVIDHPSPEVTHLMLDILPRCDQNLNYTLSMLPPDVIVIGGNLDPTNNRAWNLLSDEIYLAQNAAITAHCALKLAIENIHTTFADTPTLILGWGRIGKCLAAMLKSLNCPVTVAARKPSDRAMLLALGYNTQDTASVCLKNCSLLFNTVPNMLLTKDALAPYPDLIKIELASSPGMEGENILSARGLPGIHAPISSGRLIANTILRYLKKEEKL